MSLDRPLGPSGVQFRVPDAGIVDSAGQGDVGKTGLGPEFLERRRDVHLKVVPSEAELVGRAHLERKIEGDDLQRNVGSGTELVLLQ